MRRGNLVVYGEEKGTDGKVKGGVADALRKERTRPLTQQEMKLALDDIQKLSTNDEAKEQVEQVRLLLQPLLGDKGQASTESSFPQLTPLEFGTHEGQHVLRLGQTSL